MCKDNKIEESTKTASLSNSACSNLLYGVVEWMGDNAKLDGMKYFLTKSEALVYANKQEKMSNLYPEFDVSYTIIRLEKAI